MPAGNHTRRDQPPFQSTLTLYKSCKIICVTRGWQNYVNELLGGSPGPKVSDILPGTRIWLL
jgi:hypothetical protein